ncbi:hypothetical protein CDL15_Pgr025897 [Punica granatum]|uniref:Telomere repeat-binding protein 4-like n=1 Tax=Punica granatum TaxID=22663 RepID=A0A218WC66_PUNGR|nr:hypothetical protein CDL15_Pgr025897 [Punica granatum]PKI72368.1 hypothetical protein CRG98_007238 [Punica granatum]
MVLKKSVHNRGTAGFQFPVIPRARRSARRRGPREKIIDANQICAIELLASLAGKLLQESESSSASSNASEDNNNNLAIGKGVVKRESQDEDKLLKAEPFVPISGKESACISEQAFKMGDIRGRDDVKPITCKSKSNGQPWDYNHRRELKDVEQMEKKGHLCNRQSTKKSEQCRLNSLAPMSLDSKTRLDTKLGCRDDDGNFPNYSRLSKKFKTFRHPQSVGDRRIRKLLTFKHWKASPKCRDQEPAKIYGGRQPFYRKRKVCFNHERSHRDLLYKRRKLFDRGSVVTSDGFYSSESMANSPRKANGVSASILARQNSFRAEDSHVKFSIKSFKIPELLIEVPQTATVGSLKRTVMEAVTAILGGGLRVGVVLEGKKIRDDSRTLVQSGISCKDNIDTLGFTLEPNSMQVPQIAAPKEDPPLLSPHDGPLLLTRSPGGSDVDPVISNALLDPPPLMNLGNNAESNSVISDVLIEKTVPESQALVPVLPVSPRALSAVPLKQKGRCTDMAQRRIRRPFSVSEVEALVQAVEELGTGRWRDVKLYAFENAGYRTYVDLKDKWKTLVHTASISPQQRRGEPVPQGLLDRVLSAHAYWSQCQPKQGGKSQLLKIESA